MFGEDFATKPKNARIFTETRSLLPRMIRIKRRQEGKLPRMIRIERMAEGKNGVENKKRAPKCPQREFYMSPHFTSGI